MKVSVVTVTLDAERWVGDALASVAMQRGVEVESVLVDGGSTDATVEVALAVPGLRPKVLRGADGGIYDAMNKGLAVASGEALFFLNADDRLADPDALAALAGRLEQRDAALAFGDILVVDPDGDRLRSHRHVSGPRLGHESLSHQAVLARRRCFDVVGGFDTRWRICADLDWFMRCADAGLRLAHLPRLVCRCMTGGASTRQYALQLQEVRALIARRQPPWQRWPLRLGAGWRRRLRQALDR
jgi:glycosyltransferase